MAVFRTPKVIRGIVTTCLKHKANITGEYPEHFIRSENNEAMYQNDFDGRLSVLVPAKSLQETSPGVCTALFRFPCYNSCLLIDSSRLAKAIFNLEYGTNVLGCACVDIKVCAAPGQDRTVAEGDDNMPKSKRKESSSRTSSTGTDLQLYASLRILLPLWTLIRVRSRKRFTM